MKVLDANGDGKLTPDELAAAAEKFGQLDADGSGDLDSRELLGESNDTENDTTTRSEELTRQVFEGIDANGDAKISMDEAKAEGAERLAENFERIDANADGEIDLDEFTKSVTSSNEAETPPADAPAE